MRPGVGETLANVGTAHWPHDGGLTAHRRRGRRYAGRHVRDVARCPAIDRDRVAALMERERAILRERTAGPARLRARQRRHARRRPVAVPEERPVARRTSTRGQGSQVWDVDGNEYIDFHNGFGVMCVGHANPSIAAAVKARMDEGTHFAAPTEGSIIVAEELRRRWGLPHWRFTNSGTESTMDAIHLARGLTGRDIIVKIEGTYHGHHDAVMVSVKPPAGRDGRPRERPNPVALRPRLRARHRRAHARRAVQRRRGAGRAARRAGRRRRDHGAGDDEHEHRPAGRRLPRARARAHRATRRRDDLRRGQDRRGGRRGRRDRAVRRHARRRVPGQGDVRRPARRRDRHDRRAGRAGRRRPGQAAGHVQRQPADDGRRAGDAARRPDRPRPTRSCTPPTRS